MNIYDAIIIGAGPAGLSAGIYLARFRRKALIIDAEKGRSSLPGVYHNIAGFLKPVERRKLRQLGAKQAGMYGAEEVFDKVINIESMDEDKFKLVSENNIYFARNIIFCTGIMDNWPEAEGFMDYVGYTLHSCPVCAGYETIDKRVIVVGDERVAGYALEIWPYTKKIKVVSSVNSEKIDLKYMNSLKKMNIPVYQGKIVKFVGQENKIEKVILDNGMELEADIVYSAQGSHVKSELAKKLGVAIDEGDCIIVNKLQETNINGIYAAGDVTSFDNKQVVTALYEGYMAAHSIHKKLLREEIDKI
ncbi:MAG: hypothetical protein A2287_03570 [Candidatus Melainabacteria bacterium RIFOXYA12_FULL_32_12]|nr:MAG: hypothetical protein A2104_06590 [Candidatus Melainabacteria bacterium GWF2_32_7]OGI18184.1 MAG: hypothetical protein A2255_10915 [Candidatus Melainabacteria bacterium RIFOXYA2_FULL_32_9]OGI30086.1 MAG: hypothetical protein A2287_03570 [Candidatus Melainabacteria bacterium RIFOXYA12_FULL_32_12]